MARNSNEIEWGRSRNIQQKEPPKVEKNQVSEPKPAVNESVRQPAPERK
jgi:hypothetical protein